MGAAPIAGQLTSRQRHDLPKTQPMLGTWGDRGLGAMHSPKWHLHARRLTGWSEVSVLRPAASRFRARPRGPSLAAPSLFGPAIFASEGEIAAEPEHQGHAQHDEDLKRVGRHVPMMAGFEPLASPRGRTTPLKKRMVAWAPFSMHGARLRSSCGHDEFAAGAFVQCSCRSRADSGAPGMGQASDVAWERGRCGPPPRNVVRADDRDPTVGRNMACSARA